MDVKGISQGGQANYDLTSKTIEQCNSGQVNDSSSSSKADKNAVEVKEINNKEINEKDLKRAIGKLNKFLEDNKTHAEYETHEKFGDIMVRIIDDSTGKVIQEMPPKKILDMVAKMCELVGVIFDKKA